MGVVIRSVVSCGFGVTATFKTNALNKPLDCTLQVPFLRTVLQRLSASGGVRVWSFIKIVGITPKL